MRSPISYFSLFACWLLAGLITILSCFQAKAQIVTPASASLVIPAPQSIYLVDYVDATQQRLALTVVFNDFNESSWNVRLRLLIEGPTVKLQTKQDFRPKQPISLVPGTPVTFSGSDLEEYFQLPNLDVLGTDTRSITQNGRLPEGYYNFSLEVLDYATGKVLSNKSVAAAQLKLLDPPLPLAPYCEGAMITPYSVQNIFFSWQDYGAKPSAAEYKLFLYELTDLSANPTTALLSGKTLPIFQSDFLTTTSFQYSNSEPALDEGKAYVYQVQALDVNGRDTYKNQGKSKVCWLYYGYPSGNMIEVTKPLNNATTKSNELPLFEWKGLSRFAQDQQVTYKWQVFELQEGQTPQNAVENNTPWYETVSSQVPAAQGMQMALPKPLEKGKRYAWQVRAFTQQKEVGLSKISVLNGPPFLEQFYAGMHPVWVSSIDNADTNQLSGTGKLLIGPADTLSVSFSGLALKRVAGIYVLEQGVITKWLSEAEHRSISLSPKYEQNGTATFQVKGVKLDKYALYVNGGVKWAFPHAVTLPEQAFVRTNDAWINYDTYRLRGISQVKEGSQYPLAEPSGFILQLGLGSDFLITDNEYTLRFSGNIQMPSTVLSSEANVPYLLPFQTQKDLFYIEQSLAQDGNLLAIAQKTRIYLKPTFYTIDFSELQSPTVFSNQAMWKGIVFHQFDLRYKPMADMSKQLAFAKEINHPYKDLPISYVQSGGLNLEVKDVFSTTELGYFNTFPSKFKELYIKVENASYQKSYFAGSIMLPFLSATAEFSYLVPLSENGFQDGYLTDTENKSYTFNPGAGQQEIKLFVSRAVFEEQERLDISCDITWPHVDLSVKGLTGLKAYGDYGIGFNGRNGSYSLPDPLQAKLEGYNLEVDFIGAGSNNGLYALGTSAKVNMGDDVAGGANTGPVVNLYSMMPSAFISGAFTTGGQEKMTAHNQFTPDWGKDKWEVTVSDLNLAEKTVQSSFADNSVSTVLSTAVDENLAKPSDLPDDESYRLEIESDEEAKSQNNTISQIIALLKLVADEETKTKLERLEKISENTTPAQQGKLLEQLFDLDNTGQLLVDYTVDKICLTFTEPIDKEVNKLNEKIQSKVAKAADSIYFLLEPKLKKVFSKLEEQLQKVAAQKKLDIKGPLSSVVLSAQNSTLTEVRKSLQNSANKNITTPIVNGVVNAANDKFKYFVRAKIRANGYALLKGDVKAIDLDPNLQGLLQAIVDTVGQQVNFETIGGMLAAFGYDFVNGIDYQAILRSMQDELLASGLEAIATRYVQDKVLAKVQDSKLFNEKNQAAAGVIADNVAANVKFDFNNLGDKIKNGQIDQIIKFDPTHIKISCSAADIEGLVKIYQNDPKWGDCFRGVLKATLKINLPLKGIEVEYINGHKEDFHFWYFSLDIKGLRLTLAPPVITLTGAGGLVFSKMERDDHGEIFPNKNNNYGLGLKVFLADVSGTGELYHFDVTVVAQFFNDGYKLSIGGGFGALKDVLTGQSILTYDSRSSCFTGNAEVNLNATFVCAYASTDFLFAPYDWYVNFGRPDKMNNVKLICMDWLKTEYWTGINGNGIKGGMETKIDFDLHSPTLDLGIVSAYAYVYLHAGVRGGFDLQFRPKFGVLSAYVEVWASSGVGVHWETAVRSGNFDFFAINFFGGGYFRTIPNTNIRGRVSCSVTVVGQSAGFDFDFDKNL